MKTINGQELIDLNALQKFVDEQKMREKKVDTEEVVIDSAGLQKHLQMHDTLTRDLRILDQNTSFS